MGLYTNELTASAPSYFQDDPAAFGIPSKYLQTEPPNLVRNRLSTSPGDGVTATSISTQPSAPLRSFDSGAIVVGMASINNIIESIECISGYSAEGGAYDPIVIKELAQRYITSQSEIPPGSSPSPVAITSTGLHHRNISPPVRPEWGYETFVPSCAPGYDDSTPILSELFPSSIPLSRSVHEAVNACQWNCLVAKSVGLAGHSMIWNALMSLIPVLMISAESHSTSSQGFTSTLPETSSLNYAMETLCELLVELIDCGDCQHFVICCEILRNVDIHFTTHDHIPHHDDDHSHRPEPASSSHYVPSQSMPPSSEMAKKSLWKSLQQTIGELRIREGYVAYLELLFKLGLYQLSNAIIVRSTDKYITQLSQQGVIIRSSCAQCSKEINVDTTGGSTSSAASSSNSTASSSSTSNSSRMMSIWCLKCHKCVDLCSLCQQPVKGLLKWCQICGHGGHPQCIFKWFSQHEVCPTGCGHKCQPNGQCSEVIGNSSGNASGGCLLSKK